MGKEPVGVSHLIESEVAIWFKGAPSSFQFGISSSSARVSITAPDRMCAPDCTLKKSVIVQTHFLLYNCDEKPPREAERSMPERSATADSVSAIFAVRLPFRHMHTCDYSITN